MHTSSIHLTLNLHLKYSFNVLILSHPYFLQTLLTTVMVLVLMAILNFTVETKPLKVQLNGTIKTVMHPRKALKSLLENYDIFKTGPDFAQIQSDYDKFEFIRDLYKDQCETIKTMHTLGNGIVPIKIPMAKCTGIKCRPCKCSAIKVAYQLVKKNAINKDFGKQMKELIIQEVTVAYKPRSKSC